VRDFGPLAVGASVCATLARVERVHERPAGVADRLHGLLDAALAVVLNDEAGVGGDIGFEVGVDSLGIAGNHLDPGVVEAPGEGPAFDKEVDLEARQKYFVERPDD